MGLTFSLGKINAAGPAERSSLRSRKWDAEIREQDLIFQVQWMLREEAGRHLYC